MTTFVYCNECGNRWRVSCNFLKQEGRNVLFNDAFNTFYLWLYRVWHTVTDLGDYERGNPLLILRGAVLSDWQQDFFYMHHLTDSTHHGLCYTTYGTLGGSINSLNGSTMWDGSDSLLHHEQMFYHWSL